MFPISRIEVFFSELHRVIIVFHQVSFFIGNISGGFLNPFGSTTKELYKNFHSTQPSTPPGIKSIFRLTLALHEKMQPPHLFEWRESGSATHRQLANQMHASTHSCTLCNMSTVFLLLTSQSLRQKIKLDRISCLTEAIRPPSNHTLNITYLP